MCKTKNHMCIYAIFELWTHLVFNVTSQIISLVISIHIWLCIYVYIYLIVLLQTSKCHFPQASEKNHPKRAHAICFGAPNPPFQWIVLPGFQETHDFLGGPEISIYAWHCRWDNQLPFDGKVLLIYYLCWWRQKSKASLISQGKRMKDRKESHDPIPNKNLASIATISKVGMLMINRVISQQHQNRNPTKTSHAFLYDSMPPKQWEPHWLQLSHLP